MPERRLVSADADDALKNDKLSEEQVTDGHAHAGHSRDDDDPALDGARAEIARTRDEVALSVIALQRELARSTDWRTWVGRKPVLALSLAFAIGFVIGHQAPPRR